MWWTSRGSPLSRIKPALTRVPSRTKWWWTPAVASKAGIGQRCSSTPRSERMRYVQPAAMAWLAFSQTVASARSSPSPPSATG
ncbi:MAG: hypothetical protein USCGTAYLOR_03016 [Chromatiales bacterium USCg_Taylor]|nr:MAG: hypothetical protein USCGTAYLOR_03016 [Chromatiales bacterium USCg_Taylor]